jgi:hypothetical protein
MPTTLNADDGTIACSLPQHLLRARVGDGGISHVEIHGEKKSVEL